MQEEKHLWKVVQPCESEGHIVHVPVDQGQLSDVFRTADFTFSATVLPHDHEVQHATPEQQAAFAQHQPTQPTSVSPTRRKLAGLSSTLGSFLKTAQSTIQGLGGDVDKIVAVAQLAANAALGNVNSQTSGSYDLFDYNYDNVTGGPQCQFDFEKVFSNSTGQVGSTSISTSTSTDISGVCQNCFAHLGITISAGLSIQNSVLQSASLILTGTATFQSTFNMTIAR